MKYETIIGLEVHAQLLTKSKMFCSCSVDYAYAPPNTHVCPICLGMPGVLPTINKKAIEYTAMTALALNCTISEWAKFDRKNYPYPDLMKGYQISQYDAPIGKNGWLILDINGKQKKIGITRVHLEEDVAKLLHRVSPEGESYSLMDVNRAGVPLMEIVSEPDINSPEEARLYLIKLRTILQYLNVSTGNMEEGSFRCDANISIRPVGSKDYLPKVEVKNMNSFKAVYRALEYEVKRQVQVLDENGKLIQETRGWADDKGITVSQRSKEYAHDYRYFPEPDLPPFTFDAKWIEEIRSRLTELPDAKKERFMSQYELSSYDAGILVESKATATYFEDCVDIIKRTSQEIEVNKKAKKVANWLLGDYSKLLNANNLTIENSKIKPDNLVELINVIDSGLITGPTAKAIFEEMFNSGRKARDLINEKGLSQINDDNQIKSIVEQVIKNNPQAITDYRAGKHQSLGFLVGQAMKISKGRADPETVKRLIIENIGG